MNRQVDRTAGVARAVVRGARSDRITFIAASLAYYAFISLVPLLLLTVVAASVFGGPDFAGLAAERVGETLGPEAGALVEDALTATAGRGGATVVGVVALLWSALKVFRGLDVAFSTVYGSHVDPLPDQVRDALVVLLAVGLGVVLTVAVGALAAYAEGRNLVLFPGLVASAIMLTGLTVTLLPLYYVLPDADLTVRQAVPGAALAAVGWTALQWGFRIYAARAGAYEAYGAIGGVLLLVTFLYFGGLVLLLGAVLNAVLTGRVDGRDLDADGVAAGSVTAGGAVAGGPGARASGAGVPGSGDPDREHRELSRRHDIERVDVADRIDVDEADEEELAAAIERLQEELAEFEASVEERTVHREEIESELKGYVRKRVRAGKARGWGPYLVLLYGTAMTIGAFVELSGGWAILAMFVVWLSTLGLYVMMLLVGAMLGLTAVPGKLKGVADRVR